MICKIMVASSQFPGKGEALIHFVFEDSWKKDKRIQILDKISNGNLTRKINLHNFLGRDKQVVFCEINNDYQTIFLAGLGKTKDFTLGKFKHAFAFLLRNLSHDKINQVNVFSFKEIEKDNFQTGKNLALAFYLANYYFTKHKNIEARKKIHLIKELSFISDKKNLDELNDGIRFGSLVAEGTYLVRDLVNEPASHLHPETLVNEALKIKKESAGKISVEILEEEDCRELGMGAFLGVAQGSEKKPKFIILKYQNPAFAKATAGKPKKICLIGKSITFDSGGLSLKPSKGMEEMKTDMAGGATVLGVFKVLAGLKSLKTIVYGILPACENMPSGSAIHPGDIVTAIDGKTIEVINTDAEGRLTLVDGLAYAEKNLKPDLIIDIATLTGACMVALGKEITGLFGNNKKLTETFQKTAEKESEELWQLPCYHPYLKKMESEVADIKNISGTGYGGAITAALFLGEFVKKTPWIHLDIAGPSLNNEEPHGVYGTGGTGWGLTTLIEYIINYN